MRATPTAVRRPSDVPSELKGALRFNPLLPRWAKLSRAILGLWQGVLLGFMVATPALAVDHPGIPNSSECLSCHAEKAKGQSVHFDFKHACAVCHVVNVAEGKTSVTLALPKEQICYSCHEKAAMDQVPYMKGECVSCHDPHNSERLFLLRPSAPVPKAESKP